MDLSQANASLNEDNDGLRRCLHTCPHTHAHAHAHNELSAHPVVSLCVHNACQIAVSTSLNQHTV